jgi:hypothetical protein
MSQENLAMVLAAYQRRKNLENMVAPLVSICIHVLVALGLLLFYKPAAPQMESAVVEVKMQEEEIKEIEDEKVLEELDKLEQQADEQPVPQTEIPEVVEQVAEISEDFGDPDLSSTNDEAMDFSDALDIKANDTPLKISALYEGRSAIGRMNALKKRGGNQQTESAVLRALRWLKKTQKPDGSWTEHKNYLDAITGLCLLAYLAHGETPKSEEFGDTVQKSMQYLADRVNANALPKGDYYPYFNGIVAYALAEAYGMTKIPFLRPPMEASLQVVMDGQQTGGGYDYNYKQGPRWDLSIACWQYQAMKAGFVAGANVKDLQKGMAKGVSFIRNITYTKPHSETDRPFTYSNKLRTQSDGMQGAAVLCLQLFGEGNCPEAKVGLEFIDKVINNPKHPNESRVQWRDDMWKTSSLSANPLYYWYYCTQAMFHVTGRPWKDWNDHFVPMCIAKQNPEGYWDSPGAGLKDEIDKWYTTALCALSLQVYYRYLPTYNMPKEAVKVKKTTMESLDDDLGLEL